MMVAMVRLFFVTLVIVANAHAHGVRRREEPAADLSVANDIPFRDGAAPAPTTLGTYRAQKGVVDEVPPLVAGGSDPCFYNNLNQCDSCVLQEGCGYCADGPASVKGKCMSGTTKGPLLHRGCSAWLYRVCKVPKVTPPYIPPSVPVQVHEPHVLPKEEHVPVVVLPTNKTNLAPWKAPTEPEEPKRPNIRMPQHTNPTHVETSTKAPPPPVEGFNMSLFVQDLLSKEAAEQRELESEKNELDAASLRRAQAGKEAEVGDEGMDDYRSTVFGMERRDIRERKKKLEEVWKQDNMRKLKRSLEVQERKELQDMRAEVKELNYSSPPEAAVKGRGTFVKAGSREQRANLEMLHNNRGFILPEHHLEVNSHWQLEQEHAHLGSDHSGETRPRTQEDKDKIAQFSAAAMRELVYKPYQKETFKHELKPNGTLVLKSHVLHEYKSDLKDDDDAIANSILEHSGEKHPAAPANVSLATNGTKRSTSRLRKVASLIENKDPKPPVYTPLQFYS